MEIYSSQVSKKIITHNAIQMSRSHPILGYTFTLIENNHQFRVAVC